MLYIVDNNTDPQWNLAAEEYLLKNFNVPIFRLWQNQSSIIIGHHQNALAEINLDFVTKHSIPVVRRLSGGGAVFHDLGNVNFTFIDNKADKEDSSAMFARFTKPIINVLKSLGVEAYLEGRNDLLIDGKKFSGNAICIYKNRVLQHGTLLYSSSMKNLSDALSGRPEKFIGKSVQSNRSRVTNISDHLPNAMDIKDFIHYVNNYIITGKDSLYSLYEYNSQDLECIQKLKEEKYGNESWNFGQSPKYQFSKISKFSGGLIEMYLNVEKGDITDLKIYGDYFFSKDTQEFEQLFIGCAHNLTDIKNRIKKINLSDYFHNISEEEFISMFWE